MIYCTLKEEEMQQLFGKITEKLVQYLNVNTYAMQMEDYILSKNIQCVSDVEYWTREYEREFSTQSEGLV